MDWRQRLSRWLASPAIDDYERARMQAEAGLSGAPMPRTNPNSDRDVGRMADHFGSDLAAMPPDWLGAVRDAERVCACCRTVDRCHAWFASRPDQDSPRLFCPNAETFDQLAAAALRRGD